MTRREEAIKMLEEWADARRAAVAFEPISMSTAKVLRREADDLLEPILMLMGIDQTPAAHLEVTP